jgi:hypothetical protein
MTVENIRSRNNLTNTRSSIAGCAFPNCFQTIWNRAQTEREWEG